MIQRLWHKLPEGFRKRPFDAYTAIALIAVGLYAIFDPFFPEAKGLAISALLFHVIEIYFIVASITLLTSLFSNKNKHPEFYYLGQMYSWAFIAAAGISVMTFLFWTELFGNRTGSTYEWLIFFLFGCVGWAAFVRAVDLWIRIDKFKKEQKWMV